MIEQNFDAAFERVGRLVADFQKHEKAYLATDYKEDSVRKDFIDKFWIALGWDVYHEHQTNPYEQDVKAEKNVDVKGRIKKADYAFLAANFRDVRFFVEAKKPSRNIDNADDYFQTIRYGWNAQTPLSILTDFEQFRVLDCRYKPDVATALNRVVKKFHYTDYADTEKFKEIYYLFSREAVTGGALEDYAKTLPKPTGKAKQRGLFGGSYKSVDEDFLAELDELRDELARSFKNKNPQLDGEDLTEATQRTLDRLVFMRFLEDKLIEPEIIVERLGERGTAWADFTSESQRLDRIYNGIIFKQHQIIDDAGFVVDERVFGVVRERLSHTNSPYDFNALPVHILGSIYERFLGKVIETTDKRAKVVEKPEVRKAGGVYYTPEYIVRYIVRETIGKQIAGKNPADIALMRFADIACGSGSFLLGVYDELLRYHTGYYNRTKRTRAEALKAGCVEREDGSLALSLVQKREILLKNIYGVDIDAQAVEVAQLSLFLKLLEDETTATARQQMTLKHALLPNLGDNIKCGNSLVGWDIGGLFGDEEDRKINPMDFEGAFPEVMKRGGFDAIVGNPPYGAELNPQVTEYIRKRYETATKSLDTYVLFMERAVQLLKPSGKLSVIVPTGWYSGARFSELRRYIACKIDPEGFVNLPYDVFSAWVDTTVYVATKRETPTKWRRLEPAIVSLRTFPKRHKISDYSEFYENLESVNFVDWFTEENDEYLTYANADTISLMRKIQKRSKPLQYFADIQRGVTPFALTDEPTHPNSRPAFDGTLRRYSVEANKVRYIRFDETLAEPKPEKYFVGERILLRELISRQFQLQATMVNGDFITNKSFQSILKLSDSLSLNYLLGALNSRLMSWYFLRQSNIAQRDDFPKIVLKETRSLPIPIVDLNSKSDRARHDKMVSLVEGMLAAKKQLQLARTDRDKDFYTNKCHALDRQIDALVYELYELLPEEIALVEAADEKR